MKSSLLLSLGAALALGGCATAIRGTDEVLQVHSSPSSATVTTSTGQSCVTPCALTVARKDDLSVTIARLGYEPQTILVTSETIDGAIGDSIAGGGLIGLAIDNSNGANRRHAPNPVVVALDPA